LDNNLQQLADEDEEFTVTSKFCSHGDYSIDDNVGKWTGSFDLETKSVERLQDV